MIGSRVATLWLLALMGCSGGDGPSQALRVVPELPGENCPQGGSAILSGADRNGNGGLDDDEVQATTYVCDNAVLVRADREPLGDNCPSGGTALHSGTDDNDNGALDGGETDQTVYVCNNIGGILEGDALINSALDVAFLNTFSEVTGGIQFSSTAAVRNVEITVATVGGEIYLNSLNLVSMSFPNLDSIGRGLFIQTPYCGNIETVALPVLSFVGGDVYVRDCDKLAELSLPALAGQVDGYVWVVGNALLASVSLPLLASTGQLEIQANASLTSINMPTIGMASKFTVSGNAMLAGFDFSGLAGITGNFAIDNNPLLPCAAAIALRDSVTIGGSSSVTNNLACPSSSP